MARYFHITTSMGTTVHHVKDECFPTLANGMVSFETADGKTVDVLAAEVLASHFETRRPTPKLDAMKANLAEDKERALASLKDLLRYFDGFVYVEDAPALTDDSLLDKIDEVMINRRLVSASSSRLESYLHQTQTARTRERKPKTPLPKPTTKRKPKPRPAE